MAAVGFFGGIGQIQKCLVFTVIDTSHLEALEQDAQGLGKHYLALLPQFDTGQLRLGYRSCLATADTHIRWVGKIQIGLYAADMTGNTGQFGICLGIYDHIFGGKYAQADLADIIAAPGEQACRHSSDPGGQEWRFFSVP